MRRGAKIAAVGVTAALAVGAVVAHDPYLLVRAHYERQRVIAGLDEDAVEVAGHRWVYAHADDAPADAPTLVMLHGFTGSKENWYPLADHLRGRYRLLIPDLPGWGESERQPDADYGYGAQAARVADFIAQLAGTDDGVVLLGHSMGGGIAAVLAGTQPRRVESLVLMDAAGVTFDNRFAQDVLAGGHPFGVADRRGLEHYLQLDEASFASADYGVLLDGSERRRRYVIQSLLQRDGLDLAQYRDQFGSECLDDLPQLDELLLLALAERNGPVLTLTQAGMARADTIGPWLVSEGVAERMREFDCA